MWGSGEINIMKTFHLKTQTAGAAEQFQLSVWIRRKNETRNVNNQRLDMNDLRKIYSRRVWGGERRGGSL